MSIFKSGAKTQKAPNEAEKIEKEGNVKECLAQKQLVEFPLRNDVSAGLFPSVVVVCFGTTNISGDALGPVVGSLLRERYNIRAFVYGTQEYAITGANMKKWIDFIQAVHPDATVLAIDASLGEKSRVGQLVVRTDGVCPAAVKGKRARFGDVGLLGVVGENDGDALMQLMQVSPVYIDKMADKVAYIVNCALDE